MSFLVPGVGANRITAGRETGVRDGNSVVLPRDIRNSPKWFQAFPNVRGDSDEPGNVPTKLGAFGNVWERLEIGVLDCNYATKFGTVRNGSKPFRTREAISTRLGTFRQFRSIRKCLEPIRKAQTCSETFWKRSETAGTRCCAILLRYFHLTLCLRK